MEDHSIEIQLFFFGSAVLLGLEAMKAGKWRSYFLWSLTGLFAACGALWYFIRELSPPVTGFVTTIATSPQSWFVLFVLAMLWLVVSGRRKALAVTETPQNQTAPPPARYVPPFEDRALQTKVEKLEERLSEITKDDTKRSVDFLKSDHDSTRIVVIYLFLRRKLDEFNALEEKLNDALFEKVRQRAMAFNDPDAPFPGRQGPWDDACKELTSLLDTLQQLASDNFGISVNLNRHPDYDLDQDVPFPGGDDVKNLNKRRVCSRLYERYARAQSDVREVQRKTRERVQGLERQALKYLQGS